ncbi:MAG TPA: CbtA family protein [Rubrobacteraceae bacterium]|nr:CbtA family protein [Rubrobacteraceae bacterium]
MFSAYLRRGMAAGLLAGLLAGLFALFVGEPLLDRAIEMEHASGGHSEEVFSRATQKVGLFFATGLFGVTVGGIFGLVYAVLRDRLSSATDWARSNSLSAAIFAGAVLIPFLKYPANPPTVGDPATIGDRTIAYFTMVALSLLALLVAWISARLLRERGIETPPRQLAVGVGLAVVVVFLFVTLPDAASPGDFPAGLLWSFRLSSLGTQLVLWTGLGVVFGLLCERANRKSGVA